MAWILSGAFVVILVMVDVVWTTLTTQGSGPLTTWVTDGAKWLSGGVRRLFRRRAVVIVKGWQLCELSWRDLDNTYYGISVSMGRATCGYTQPATRKNTKELLWLTQMLMVRTSVPVKVATAKLPTTKLISKQQLEYFVARGVRKVRDVTIRTVIVHRIPQADLSAIVGGSSAVWLWHCFCFLVSREQQTSPIAALIL